MIILENEWGGLLRIDILSSLAYGIAIASISFFFVGLAKLTGRFATSTLKRYTKRRLAVSVMTFIVEFPKAVRCKGGVRKLYAVNKHARSILAEEEIQKINKYALAAFDGASMMVVSAVLFSAAIGLMHRNYWAAILLAITSFSASRGVFLYIEECIKNGSRFRNFKTIDPNKYKE